MYVSLYHTCPSPAHLALAQLHPFVHRPFAYGTFPLLCLTPIALRDSAHESFLLRKFLDLHQLSKVLCSGSQLSVLTVFSPLIISPRLGAHWGQISSCSFISQGLAQYLTHVPSFPEQSQLHVVYLCWVLCEVPRTQGGLSSCNSPCLELLDYWERQTHANQIMRWTHLCKQFWMLWI